MSPEVRRRLIIGGSTFAVATVLLGVLTGLPRFVSFGVSIGVVLTLVAAWAILKAMGAFIPTAASLEEEEPQVGGDEEGSEGGARRRTFWQRELDWLVVLIGALLFLPMLGAGGLWDPWETHYGEVARRMLEQDDWISMWWENEWFYSKPVLIMWLDALGMALVGANPYPDGMLFGAAWGMRLPVAMLAIFCMWGVYHVVSRRFGRRAGFVSAIALGTMPTFAFLSHQTMTDMPYVASMSLALVFLACALEADDAHEIRGKVISIGRRLRFELNAHQALVTALVVTVLPFNLYLLSRPRMFYAGSLGQENVRAVSQVVDVPLLVIGVAALAGLAWVLWSLQRERRARRLYLLVGYYFIGLAVLGKVLPGLVLPAMVLFFYLLVTGRWRELKRLEIPRGLAILAIVILPWYLAVVFRHGGPFIDRIIFHDIVNRAVVGVHGDTGTIDYYLQQLGYGVFPWLVLVPMGLFGFRWAGSRIMETAEGRTRVFVLIWAMAFFIFFSGVITKFHHYIFPVLVPLAILVGLAYDDLAEKRLKRPEPLLLVGVGLAAIVGWDLTRPSEFGKAGYERFVDLFIYNYRRIWPEGEEYDYTTHLTILAGAVLVCSLVLLLPFLRKRFSLLVPIAAVVFTVWLLDFYMPAVGNHWSQANLIQRYYELREGDHERIVAYQMNWKGENLYTGNRVLVYVSLKTDEFERWIKEHLGERHFFITERSRFERMRTAINRASPGAGTRMEEVGEPPGPDRGELCNKFRIGVTTL